MARLRTPSVKEAADEILREVAAERMIKTAERQLLHDVENPRTDVGAGLLKLASQLRDTDVENPEITYDDLHQFVVKCNE